MDWQAVGAELAKPLDKKHVRPAQKFGPKGDYIEGWHAIAEANRIFGPGNWTRETVECRCVMERERGIGKEQKPGWGVSYVCRVRVVVAGVVREGTGAGHGVDVDLGQAHESAIKESETDAMKRALMTFGNPFGLALYDKSRENVDDGTSYREEEHQRLLALVEVIEDEAGLGEHWKALPKQYQTDRMKDACASRKKDILQARARAAAEGRAA